MNVISIGGYNGSGKTTVAKIIQWYLNPVLQKLINLDEYVSDKKDIFKLSNYKIKSFSTKVNDAYKLITGVDFNLLNNIEKEIERPQFIQFAEGVKLTIDKKIWINSIFDTNPLYENTDYIIDDMTSDAEYSYLERLPNVKFIRVNKLCTICGSLTSHIPVCKNKEFNSTELDFYDYDATIQNNWDIDCLILECKLILKEWKMI